MESNFTLGLQVTVIGMALVFLTLIIVMFAIMLLGRVFRPKAEPEEERAAIVAERPRAVAQPAPQAPVVAAPAAQAVVSDSDEIAAIGVALARALASSMAVAPRAAGAGIRAAAVPVAVFPWDRPLVAGAEPKGEVVTVVNIEGGSTVWRSQGRLKAAERR